MSQIKKEELEILLSKILNSLSKEKRLEFYTICENMDKTKLEEFLKKNFPTN